MNSLRSVWKSCAAFAVACLAASVSQAQQQPPSPTPSKETRRAKGERDIDRFRRLDPYFRSWLNEDVVYLLSPEERKTFLDLNTDDERRQFIAQFWERRNPNPDSLENAFEEEHYRRIVYANEHFGEAGDGWKSDRGRLYVAVGPPDVVEASPAGSDCSDSGSPSEVIHDAPARITWKYRNLDGSGENFDIWFLQNSIGTGALAQSMFGMSRERCRFIPNWPEGAPEGIFAFMLTEEARASRQLARLEHFYDEQRHPQNRELEALLSSHDHRNQFPLRVQCSAIRATKITSLASVRVAIPSPANSEPVKKERGTSEEIYGRFVSRASGKMESQFELSVFPIRSGTRAHDWIELCDKALPLLAGTYELQIGVKDTVTGDVATHYSEVSVEPSALLTKSATQ